MPGKQGKVVFVGNIPYNLTETQLIDIFKEVGRVVSFRLLFDRETGKPKGYGFCTFEDAETASSAVRNLDNYCVGGRQLRVDFSENDKEESTSSRVIGGGDLNLERKQLPQSNVQNNTILGAPAPSIFQKHGAADIPMDPLQKIPGGGLTDVINNAVACYPTDQLIQALSQIKLHVHNNPESARIFLAANPQLTYAILQALLITNIVDKRLIQCMLQYSQGRGSQVPHTPKIFQKPRMDEQYMFVDPAVQNHAGDMSRLQQFQGVNPQRFPIQTPHKHMNQRSNVQAANSGGMQFPRVSDSLQEQQERFLLQIINLTPEQIMALPEDQKNSVNQLRAQLLGTRRDMG